MSILTFNVYFFVMGIRYFSIFINYLNLLGGNDGVSGGGGSNPLIPTNYLVEMQKEISFYRTA
ncbi:hypothetical protein D5R81_11390 [Parashewanella spongiae]|uniref:Uncharacterized protein n=1 Tax=Parashewanella spongiae TaxID=342950 RepID=A0A3A6TXH6_9GAMM|nr:hypothetical protein D5R81_11390 [Parashewanella spongiae]